MCNHCSENPRDTLHDGARALAGLRDLVSDIADGNQQFHNTGPQELAVILRIIAERVDDANLRLQDYVPRGHSSAA